MMKTSLKLAVFLCSMFYCFVLSAQEPDCSNYGGISVTIMDTELCSSSDVSFEFEFTPQDPSGALYTFEIYGSNGSIGFGDGDGSFGFGFIDPELIDQCDPLSIDYFADVLCDATGGAVAICPKKVAKNWHIFVSTKTKKHATLCYQSKDIGVF